MFKKKCKKCNYEISRKFKFCPSCGSSTKKTNEKDYGLLGLDDEEKQNNLLPELGAFGGNMLNKMLGSAMRMLEKEMQKEMNGNLRNQKNLEDIENQPRVKSHLQLYINGKKVDLGEMQPGQIKRINVNKLGNRPVQPIQGILDQEAPTSKLPMPDEELLIKSSKLPRQEAKHRLKRLSNKISYEIDAPGIKSLDQILINKLEEGVEVRLFTKDKVLTKNINLSLPLTAYSLRKQKLFLEFQTK